MDPAKKCDFKWGKTGNRDRNLGIQCYESFTYYGVEYFLYDCVYLSVQDDPRPYIGKLVKIWEKSNSQKKVKVVWFFQPFEIFNFLKEFPQKNEIFLASGKGEGLFNVTDLMAINGKCNVICTSKDGRNPQPSEEQLKDADYIFYRTFDVGKFQISDRLEDVIAGIGVQYFFNTRNGQELINGSKYQPNMTDRNNSLKAVKTIPCEVKKREAIRMAGEEVREMTDKGRDHKPFSPDEKLSWLNKVLNREAVKDDRHFISQREDNIMSNPIRDLKNLGASPNFSFKKDIEPVINSAKSFKKPDSLQTVTEKKDNVRRDSNGNNRKTYGLSVKSSEYGRKCVEDLFGQHKMKSSHGAKLTKSPDRGNHELTYVKGITAGSNGPELSQRPFVAEDDKETSNVPVFMPKNKRPRVDRSDQGCPSVVLPIPGGGVANHNGSMTVCTLVISNTGEGCGDHTFEMISPQNGVQVGTVEGVVMPENSDVESGVTAPCANLDYFVATAESLGSLDVIEREEVPPADSSQRGAVISDVEGDNGSPYNGAFPDVHAGIVARHGPFKVDVSPALAKKMAKQLREEVVVLVQSMQATPVERMTLEMIDSWSESAEFIGGKAPFDVSWLLKVLAQLRKRILDEAEKLHHECFTI